MKKLVAVLATIAILAMLAGCTALVPAPGETATAGADSGKAPAVVASLFDEVALTALYERCIPAVVMINVTAQGFSGQGSGFVIDRQGDILTNHHVVDGAETVTVDLHDGQELDAEIVGTDRESDLAVIRVDAASLADITPLVLGDSARVKPGQIAIAMGSPYWLEGSITAGIISGLGRPLSAAAERTIPDMLQTDAAINPGNSGGPLLNSAGEVIGINTAIETQSSGIGFAIPINTAKTLLPELLAGGEVGTPWIGIESLSIDRALANELKLDVTSGIYVISVVAGGPAEQAGLKGGGVTGDDHAGPGGDVITAVDSQPIASVVQVLAYLNGKKPGDVITLTVHRDGQVISVPVTLGDWPAQIP